MDKTKLVKIFGTEELIKLFEEMNETNQDQILNMSFREGAKLILSAAKGNLKGRYTHVQNALGMQYRKDINVLNVGSILRKGGQLAHITNNGTKERFYKTKAGNIHKTGRIIASHFWDFAVENNLSDAENIIYKDIKKRFENLIAKNNKIT